MGSASQTVRSTIDFLGARGDKLGLVTVRLFRPFSVDDFVRVIPESVRSVAVLDRTKESGGAGGAALSRREDGHRRGDGGGAAPFDRRRSSSAAATASVRRNSHRPW